MDLVSTANFVAGKLLVRDTNVNIVDMIIVVVIRARRNQRTVKMLPMDNRNDAVSLSLSLSSAFCPHRVFHLVQESA